MGNSAQTKHYEERTKEYLKKNMDKSEVKHYRDLWMDLFPSGYANKREFPKFVEAVSGGEKKKDAAFVDTLFRSMDQNRDGKISLLEFLWYEALMVTKPNCPIEYLIEHTFMVYDIDGNGYLSKKELYETMINIYKFNGVFQTCEDENQLKRQVEQRVNKIFEAVDENRDGKISQEEMMRAYRRDPQIFEHLF